MPKPEPKLFNVLILEDDLEICGRLLLSLHKVEPQLAPYDLDVTLLSTGNAVEQLINAHPERQFDVILLDRDCKLNRSFHVLDLQIFDPSYIVSISSTPMWNHEARSNGIKHCVPKSFSDLGGFADRAAAKVQELLGEKRSVAMDQSSA